MTNSIYDVARARLDTYPLALEQLVIRYLRPWSARSDDGLTLTFAPPLTVDEQAIFADLQIMARFGVTMTLAEWRAIKADAATLKAYLAITTPNLAQTAAATKAIVRVLSVIVRS